jgi:hypothetical protein
MEFKDFIIPLAWPELLVPTAEGPYDFIMKATNLCKDGFYKAGHAAFLLINAQTGNVSYFDFGRYITPHKQGRIRSEVTDPELVFSIKAYIKNGNIINIEELIKYISQHSDTHGSGTLYAGIHKRVSYQLATDYIQNKQSKAFIPYGPFQIGGTNCSRFVAQTISKSVKSGGTKFLFPFYGTPSPLGNIYNSSEREWFKCNNGKVKKLSDLNKLKQIKLLGSLLFFGKQEVIPRHYLKTSSAINIPEKHKNLPEHAKWLGGTGAGAWYFFSQKSNQKHQFGRYQANGNKDFEFWFETQKNNFNPEAPFKFTYPSHALKITISQNNETFIFLRVLE